MNKTIVKTMLAGLVCLAFCGTTFAAPGRGNGSRAPQKAPAHQQTVRPGQTGGRHAPEPNRHCEPARPCEPVAHHAPAPRQCHPAPPPPPPPEPHHGGHGKGAGLVAHGATVGGGIVGGIVGACL